MPNGFTPAERRRLLEALIARRAAGESFDAICATPGWPSRPTLRKWLRRAPKRLAKAVPAIRRPPVRWSPDVAEEVTAWVALGMPLREVCRRPGMPDRRSVRAWMRRDPDFAHALAVARVESGEILPGRRSTYSPERFDQVYLALCETGALTTACAHPGAPAPRTVRDWARAYPAVRTALATARETHHEVSHEREIERRGLSLGEMMWGSREKFEAAIAAAKAENPMPRRLQRKWKKD